jgi:hypothetical protein
VELEYLKIKTRLTNEKFASAQKRKPRGGSGTCHLWITLTELLNLQKNRQFPDESVRIKV